jgi:hypothetical protein
VQATCSCGAKLASDALFCHRCGKPLRELVDPHEPEREEAVELEAAAPPTPAPLELPIEDPPISLRNGNAVRVALVTAATAHIVSSVVALAVSFILVPVVAIFFGGLAATLYSRRTGKPVDIIRGARVGWFMGLFWFLIATILFTFSLSMQAGEGGVRGVFQKSFEAIGAQGPDAQRALQMLDNPSTIIVVILFALGFQFLLLTLIGSMGGALAARLLHRKQG